MSNPNRNDSTRPLLPLRGGVLLPGTVMTIPVGRRKSIALLEDLPRRSDPPEVIVAVQRDARVNDPSLADLHPVATVAQVVKVARAASSAYMVTLRGRHRVTLESLAGDSPYWTAWSDPADGPSRDATQAGYLADALVEQLLEVSADDNALAKAIANRERGDAPGLFADQVAGALDLSHEQAVSVMLTLDAVDRLERVIQLAGETLTASEMKRRIKTSVRQAFDKQQRESILRQQLQAIRKELGDEDTESEADQLALKLKEMELPEEVRSTVDRELRRLRKLNPAQAEYNVARTYLEIIADLPWTERAEVADDLDAVAERLDADHFGLDQVKRRILEHMAVLKLSGAQRGTILCLAGPPGTGKTSLARSIAEATGRPFVRIALGGVRDEAEIRGHRRTYVGALPGRLVAGLRKAKARNPVMLLDEIDKLSPGFRGGSPESALLEVLDPEQNVHFTDHYLELPFDLSEVLFVCTANVVANLSAPLRDRLEIVEVEGYTQTEKLQIAREHLIPRQLDRHGIGGEEEMGLEVTEDALKAIIRSYTREAGVRQLEREIIRLCRATAYEVARGTSDGVLCVDEGDLFRHLGKPKFRAQVAERTALPGVATGLAWTPVGGDILFIETSRMPGKGRLEITGQLGDVMKESARAALAYVRSNAEKLGIDSDFLDTQDLHIHVPAGAIPKDGPSAGVTIFTALTSLLTGRCVRSNVAMTGECTLRGRVLPVGGIKAKVLAAHRAGIEHVVIPHQNERDIDDVPEEVRDTMRFTLADDMSQVLDVALEEEATLLAPSSGSLPDAQAPGANA